MNCTFDFVALSEVLKYFIVVEVIFSTFITTASNKRKLLYAFIILNSGI